ncbi:MAG TPA: cob(I)yrinic acid a,c-diamide adenosyltransferase, partial [Hanamia sp.]|nr:cob(I)yrinic acid a,c-diamide adenosyltransferase [Hanamia sp.]
MKIYTKTGDSGKTSLLGGTKVFKNNPRIEAYGTVDELNSYIGLLSDFSNDDHAKNMLKEIQDRLFTIGSELACDPDSKMPLPDLHESDIEYLEKEIDNMQYQLPVMKNFILPGGHPAVSFAHVARCVCRRAERCTVNLQEN